MIIINCYLLVVVLLASLEHCAGVRMKSSKFHEFHRLEPSGNLTKDYSVYLLKFYPRYNKTDKFQSERRQKFANCRQKMMDWNPDKAGYAVGINRFCHWTDKEFNKTLNYLLSAQLQQSVQENVTLTPTNSNNYYYNRTRRSPPNFSWLDQGAVTSVKDQGLCGNCYAFAAAAALESAYLIKNKALHNLSAQQYTDCSVNYTVATMVVYKNGKMQSSYDKWFDSPAGNDGCNGGTPRACWSYNNRTASQSSWQCYPFVSGASGQEAKCAVPSCEVRVGGVNYVNVAANDEKALLQAVNISPVACGIDAATLQFYAGGIFTGEGCSKRINHAVTVVGYGTENGVDYWLIKNSWGTEWGQNGYLQLLRGLNTCGIASSCAYPTVTQTQTQTTVDAVTAAVKVTDAPAGTNGVLHKSNGGCPALPRPLLVIIIILILTIFVHSWLP